MTYDFISDNILAHENGISFIYKLPEYNTYLGTSRSKINSNNVIVDIIRKMSLPGEIIIIPNIRHPKKIINNYYKDISGKTAQEFVSDQYNILMKKNMITYQTYIVFNETKLKIGKKKFFSTQVKAEVSANKAKRLIELANYYLLDIQQICKEASRPSPEETINLLNYMRFSTPKPTDDYIFEYTPLSITAYNETESGMVNNSVLRYFQISEFADNYANSIDFIQRLKQYQFPIDINIKFDINLDNIALERKMRHAKNSFTKENKLYKRNYSDSDGYAEYKQKESLARQAQKELQHSSTALIQMQYNIRISTTNNTDEKHTMLEKRYTTLKKFFNSYQIKSVSCLGKQDECHHNFQIGCLTSTSNIQSFTTQFAKKLSLLSGSKIGTPELSTAKIACFEIPSNKPVFIDEYAPLRGDVAKTQASICYVGSSGSGKSQLVNYHTMQNIIVNKARALIIDPKGDRKEFFKGRKILNDYVEIVIGSNSDYKGLMDLFDIDSKESSILNILDFFKLLFKLSNNKSYDHVVFNNSLREYMNNEIDCHMLGFMKFIEKFNGQEKLDELLQILKAYEDVQYANLFFGSKKKVKIDYNNELNIIIIDSIEEKNADSIKSGLFTFVFRHVSLFAKNFLREIPRDVPSEIVLEETEYLAEQLGAHLEEEFARLARSFGTVFRYVLQNPSGITDATKNNTAQWFIGKSESLEEYQIIEDQFQLESSKVSFLKTTAQSEGLREVDKYNFLLVDNNNRKARVKAEFPKMFNDIFDTHMKLGGDEVDDK